MKKTHISGYDDSHSYIEEVKISKCDLKDLVLDEQDDTTYTFFIKDEEDEWGNKC